MSCHRNSCTSFSHWTQSSTAFLGPISSLERNRTRYEGAFDVGEFAPEELDAYQALVTKEETASGRHITVAEGA